MRSADRCGLDDLATGRYYLQTAQRRMRANLSSLWNNDDEATTALANRMLRRS